MNCGYTCESFSPACVSVSACVLRCVIVCSQVNGVLVEGKQHAEVVATIKAGGDNTSLLVVDPDTDAFFKKCRVTPSAEHLTGTNKALT